MLAMAVGMPNTLSYYQAHADEMMLADHQVILASDHDEDGNAITTSNPDAVKFSMEELILVIDESEESANTYGMELGNRYADIPADLKDGEVVISSALSGKFHIEPGDEIHMKDKYGYDSYDFRVRDIIDFDGGIAVFMDNDTFNRVFDRDEGSYDGFFSKSEITDIDEEFIAAEVTSEDILKMAAQLNHSMGAYMRYFQYLCIILSAVLIFLLTKVIVERNEKSISMVKILGYTNGEVASLYLVTTTIVVIVSEIITALLSRIAMAEIWNNILKRMDGYFPFVLSAGGILRMIVLVFLGYLIVMLIDFRRIRRIPMDEALKNME